MLASVERLVHILQLAAGQWAKKKKISKILDTIADTFDQSNKTENEQQICSIESFAENKLRWLLAGKLNYMLQDLYSDMSLSFISDKDWIQKAKLREISFSAQISILFASMRRQSTL